MIAMEYKGHYSASTKKERAEIHYNLATLFSTKGPSLTAIPFEAVKFFSEPAKRHEIYKVSDLETGFKRNMDTVPGKIEYFAAWMPGGWSSSRYRKFALVDLNNGDQYLVFQETMMYSSRHSVINTRTLERITFGSAEECAGYLRVMEADIEALPLLINVRGDKLRGLVKARLCA